MNSDNGTRDMDDAADPITLRWAGAPLRRLGSMRVLLRSFDDYGKNTLPAGRPTTYLDERRGAAFRRVRVARSNCELPCDKLTMPRWMACSIVIPSWSGRALRTRTGPA